MREIRSNRVVIAAIGSGSGKTTLTCALLQALKDRGLDPVSFKCGPDYIDPMFHEKVLGIEGRNLDTFFAGKEGVQRTVAGCGGRYAVIEGVMGLFDGLAPDSVSGSCYEIASILGSPVILVVDASGVGRTVISIIKGMLTDDTEHLIKGVILNNMSEGFYNSMGRFWKKSCQ
jgi:cobyrinic acid a,c-diamide synthase